MEFRTVRLKAIQFSRRATESPKGCFAIAATIAKSLYSD
jgi:hypothetical protein